MAAGQSCERCRWLAELRAGGRVETFSYMFNALTFDVSRAREIVRDGRGAVEFNPASLRSSLTSRGVDKAHAAHVDGSEPGIVARIRLRRDGAEGTVFIDGGHRGEQALREGRPFYVYLLTEAETLSIVTDNTGLRLLAEPVQG